jgi:predicted nuclease of predicted toxin-antitoxin system
LRALGHDIVWAGDWDRDPGDEEILARAIAERRILVTLDKDFGELAIVHRMRHCGIVRVVAHSARVQGAITAEVLERYGTDLLGGAIVTAEPGRLRVRPADEP